MRGYLASLLVGLLGTLSAQGEVAVELVDMPTESFSLEPVYVLYSVENIGKTPLYLPAEGAPNRGPGVYIGLGDDTPHPVVQVTGDRPFSHSLATMWLDPGERWLFYQDIGPKIGRLEGDVTIQAVMSSDGRCGDDVRYGSHEYPLDHLHVESVQVGVVRAEVYKCWQGEARSNTRTLRVHKSEAPVDQRALQFLVENGGLVQSREGDWTLRWGRGVEERFPESHYTYAFLARQTSIYAKAEAIELQPENELNPWLLADIARRVMERRSSCGKDLPKKIPLDIENFEAPEGVEAYLRQHEWWVQHRYCRHAEGPRQDTTEAP